MNLTELFVVLLVALLVIQPKEWPVLLYQMARLVRKVSQLFSNVKTEINTLVDTVSLSKEDKSNK